MGSLYSDHPTWLHGIPAGVKLAFLALLGTGVFFTHELSVLLGSAAGCVLMFASLGKATARAKPLLMGLVVASVLMGVFHLYMQQPMVGAVSVLRLLCTTLMGIALTLTTRYTDLLGVLEWLLAPLRFLGIQPERLSLQVALMLRFTEHFFIVWHRLDDAHRLRTGKAGGFKILAPLTLHMLIAARRVADTLHVRYRR
ncbi:energy-coupling factor transporter transmembrane component T [Limnohabitans sp.]|uniref:energy-coupling factor transporter transmembrane component T family protein n=1 Tax=Limnohabitans sp. TaxID=1907725 RepID=UPI00286FA76A|nr:energy-coupling factor transporter transmembrane component T [Limnohabitans sp.]